MRVPPTYTTTFENPNMVRPGFKPVNDNYTVRPRSFPEVGRSKTKYMNQKRFLAHE